MGFLKGLKEYQEHQRKIEERANSKKTEWFKLAAGESVRVKFLQELDESSPNYDSDKGLGFIASEHTSPEDFKRRAVCTMDEDGQCLACELNRADYKNNHEKKGRWKSKQKLYINVLVDDGKSEPKVVVLSQGTGPKSVVPVLYETAIESDTITDGWFKITRTGAGFNDTSYSMIPAKNTKEIDYDALELFDLEKVVRLIPYDEQAKFYDVDVEEARSSSSSSSDDEW